MLVPNKYKNPSQNVLSIGKDIVEVLKRRNLEVYNLFKEVIKKRNDEFEIDLELFLFSLDFLYSFEIIELNRGSIVLK